MSVLCSNTLLTTYSFLSKSRSFSISFGLSMKACIIIGMQSSAFLPSTLGDTGTCLQPRNSKPSFSTITSNIFLACAHLSSFCGKKNIPTPYSLSPPILMPSSPHTRLKNRCEICVKIPTPSPVLPAASLPALCSKFSTILSASSTRAWLLTPLILTTAPIPQLSCSKLLSYSPSFTSVCMFIS